MERQSKVSFFFCFRNLIFFEIFCFPENWARGREEKENQEQRSDNNRDGDEDEDEETEDDQDQAVFNLKTKFGIADPIRVVIKRGKQGLGFNDGGADD